MRERWLLRACCVGDHGVVAAATPGGATVLVPPLLRLLLERLEGWGASSVRHEDLHGGASLFENPDPGGALGLGGG